MLFYLPLLTAAESVGVAHQSKLCMCMIEVHSEGGQRKIKFNIMPHTLCMICHRVYIIQFASTCLNAWLCESM